MLGYRWLSASSFLNRNILEVDGTGIFRSGANQAVIAQLFQNVSSPARHATDGENWSVQVSGNTEHVVNGCRIEIYVCIKTLFLVDRRLYIAGDLEPSHI